MTYQLTLVSADLALVSGLIGALGATMTLLAAEVTGAGEGALNARIGAVCLVVPDLAAVEALPSQAAAALAPLLRAVTSEMTVGTAAGSCQ